VDSAPGQQPSQPPLPVPAAGQPDPAGPGAAPPVSAARQRLVTWSAYAMLFLFGAMQGVVGCFYYSSGPVPLAAVAFDVLLLATSLLAAWGMRGPSGGLVPVAGWFLTSFVLAMSTSGGSVVITNTSAGKWFLFGGSACAVAGAVAGFTRWSRLRRPGAAR
jgi:hypothetical protein